MNPPLTHLPWMQWPQLITDAMLRCCRTKQKMTSPIQFTVITRTSGRPKFFSACRGSVVSQTLPPFHLVGSDNPDDTYPEGDAVVELDAAPGRGHNLYFNTLRHYVPRTHPWIIFLDDDDHFTRRDALQRIAAAITTEDDMVLWRVDFRDGRTVPTMPGMPPVAGDISGIGFCYHVKNWEPWPGMAYGDYFVISQLYQRLTPVWLPDVLTGIQAEPGGGKKLDRE